MSPFVHIFFGVVFLLFTLSAYANTGITAVAPDGSFVGAKQQGINIFRGIPYARPPVAELRWRAPQPLSAFSTTVDATSFGPVCAQADDWPGVRGYPQSEDCLTLNVWSPNIATNHTHSDKPLPVMLWIHGGNFKWGSGRWLQTEASDLASKGAVVVTINYRLGNLGRFAHPALSQQQQGEPLANFGLMDQVMALNWVKKNISAFGGDPENVTIFGYSAGAVSVNFLMAAPSAKGLFHNAIAQSSAVLLPVSRHIRDAKANHPPP